MSKQTDAAIGDLKDLTGRATGLSDVLTGQGAELFGLVAKYLKDVTSGDRQTLLAATMPERRRVIDQYSAAKKAIAEFSPRSGGQAAASNKLQSQEASDLAAVTSGARARGIETAGNFGMQAASLGLSAESLASGDIQALINSLMAKDAQGAQSAQNWGQIAGTIAMIALLA